MKTKILEALKKYTQEYPIEPKECFTSSFLSNECDCSRNSVSQYLNEYLLNHEVIKINTRPVYFYEVSALEEKGIYPHLAVYGSFEELLEKHVDFEALIGYKDSLKHAVEQCKAAISYPPNGLPILLNGPTGSGKSRIARVMFEYAKNHHLIEGQKECTVVNCSEYANNPELLTANLFGYKKGAYTGADKDSAGLIELADGGLLFLDEVHCLKAECQEKLFLFMDKGVFHRVGDNEKWYHSSCRLVFATTENPEDVLLKTLLRRIPILVKIPALDERPKVEKQALIASMLKKESEEIGKPIEISALAYQALMDTTFTGNVGGLLNCIKATCANAFLNQNVENSPLQIHIYNLPDFILQVVPTLNLKLQDSKDNSMLSLSYPQKSAIYDAKLIAVYERILDTYKKYIEHTTSNHEFIRLLSDVVENYNDYLMYEKKYVNNPNIDFTKKITDKIFSIVMNRYSLKISNNEILLISRYLSEYTSGGKELQLWLSEHQGIINEFSEMMQIKFPREFAIALEISDNISLNLDIDVDLLMKVRIMMMLYDFQENESSDSTTVGIILCHGYSTASSIADAANKMIGQYIFEAIDMQLDVSVDKIINQLNDFLKKKHFYDDLVLLVDMGSLEEIYKGIKHNQSVNIAIVNNVNTKLALSVGLGIKAGEDINTIVEKAVSRNLSQYKFINNRIKKKAILSVCATGVGAAEKIKEMFIKSLPCTIDAEIRAYDYHKLVENGLEDSIFSKYQVPFIIGTMNPFLEGIPFIPIEDLVLSDELEVLSNALKEFLSNEQIETCKANIIKNFTLSNIVNHLTILNAEKLLDDVEEMVDFMEKKQGYRIPAASKAGLYVHLSCLIERLILKNEIVLLDSPDEFIDQHQDFVDIVKESFSVVESRYSVELPVSEIIYIYNYIENSSKE